MNRFNELNKRSIAWATKKGILEFGTNLGQAKKTVEEAKELRDATINAENLTYEEQIALQADALGDILVCVTIMAKRLNLDILDCFEAALEIIEKRSGKMINGQFKKDN